MNINGIIIRESKPLEPYNVKRNCPKCGCAFTESKYDRQHDVMVRKCPCGYTWREAPLDRNKS